MQKILLFYSSLLVSIGAHSQNTFPATGNVGIGTAPQSALHVAGAAVSKDVSSQYSGPFIVQGNSGGRTTTSNGAQIEFVIPANTDGTNFWGQGRILTMPGNGSTSNATGKMIIGTRRSFNKLGTGTQWYYGDDITIDGTGNVGIGMVTPTTQLEVAKGIDFGSTGSQLIGPLVIGYDNDFGSGGALQYLLLAPAYTTGATGLNSVGLNGTLTFYRGNTGSYNVNADYHVNIQSAYQSTNANLIPLGENSPVLPLYTAVYNSVTYIAIKMSDLCGSSVFANYYGYYWNNVNTMRLQYVNASSVSNVQLYKNFASVSSGVLYNTVDGNIGIGTSTASAKLSIAVSNKSSISIAGNNSSYIGSDIAISRSSAAEGVGQSPAIQLNDGSNANGSWIIQGSNASGLQFFSYVGGWYEKMRFTQDGNLLINKSSQVNPGYKLDVAGDVRVNKLVVNTTGADFVFEPYYKLIPLNQLEKYVSINRHLPGIETANAMQKDGVDIGENQTKLLQKIEELTLYIIDQNKALTSQKEVLSAQNDVLKQQSEQLQQLRKELDELKASKK